MALRAHAISAESVQPQKTCPQKCLRFSSFSPLVNPPKPKHPLWILNCLFGFYPIGMTPMQSQFTIEYALIESIGWAATQCNHVSLSLSYLCAFVCMFVCVLNLMREWRKHHFSLFIDFDRLYRWFLMNKYARNGMVSLQWQNGKMERIKGAHKSDAFRTRPIKCVGYKIGDVVTCNAYICVVNYW